MSKQIRYLLIFIATALTVTFLTFIVIEAKNLLEPFRSFTVTIVNESDADIVSVETGIRSGSPDNSKHSYEKIIATGATAKIKPKLTFTGEGVIYQKFVDSNGRSRETIACGYTEYVSGHSTVTIRNDKIEVEQDCM
ncbi:hypothetical protein [Cohnella mopanensis]|uniref:hypothetical protein n=1 Tax=Cohnella mopanensis TaxID=2911966 RepID=UPI001EF7F927|nr:hypothetical protein [Cohnella mopanensis]